MTSPDRFGDGGLRDENQDVGLLLRRAHFQLGDFREVLTRAEVFAAADHDRLIHPAERARGVERSGRGAEATISGRGASETTTEGGHGGRRRLLELRRGGDGDPRLATRRAVVRWGL